MEIPLLLPPETPHGLPQRGFSVATWDWAECSEVPSQARSVRGILGAGGQLASRGLLGTFCAPASRELAN